jgi:hypothetical protein
MRKGARLAFDARWVTSSWWVRALGGVLTAGWASAVNAQDLDETEMPPLLPPSSQGVVQLTWDAPEECPRREEILQLVQIPDRASGKLVAQATVREIAGEYHLSLTTQQEGQGGHRNLTAASCKELGEVTAALLSLSLATNEKMDEAPPPHQLAPAPSPPELPLQERQRASLSAEFGLRGALGVLPRMSAGPLLRLGWERQGYRAELASYGLLPVESTHEGPGTSSYFLVAGVISGCYLGGSELRWGPCAGLEAGVIDGESAGISQAGRSAQPWITPHVAFVMVVETGRLAVQVRPLVGLPLVRPQFSIEPFGTVFQPSRVVGALDVTVGARF